MGRELENSPDAAAPAAPEAAPATPALAPGAGLGNAAMARLARDPGRPLPPGLAARLAGGPLGPAAARARIVRGETAGSGLGAALAVTEGERIALSPRAPAPDSPGGALLLTHEVAHVAQQTAGADVPALVDGAAEERADRAAVAALTGGPVPALGAAEGPQRFEARWHQATLTTALQDAGLTDAEAEHAYFANWMRDVSQLFVPKVADSVGVDIAYTLLELMALWKFGSSFTPEQMGVYDPREHIDAPGGQIDADLVQRPGNEEQMRVAGRGEFRTPFESIGSETTASLFEVNESGLPAYMDRSRGYIEEEAMAALDAGRTPEGLLHLGNLSHTVEDLFAHSNWIEIAAAKVITEGAVDLSGTPAAEAMREREEEGLPPIETYSADVADQAGNVRPILVTGSFTGADTIISIKEEATNIISELDPFAEGDDDRRWRFLLAVLGRVEDSIDEGAAGEILTSHLDVLVEKVGDLVAEWADSLGESEEEPENVFQEVAQGARELVGEGVSAAVGLGQDAYAAVLRDAIAGAVDALGPAVPLVELAIYVQRGEGALKQLWEDLKDAAGSLPDALRELILPELVAAERRFKAAIEDLVRAAYEQGVRLIMDAVEGLEATDTAETSLLVTEEHLQEELAVVRERVGATLDELGDTEAIRDAKAQIMSLPLEEVLAYLESPAFLGLMAGLALDVRAAALREELQALGDVGERVLQLQNMPEWAKAGPSHSQIAKDHADSPFFGAAFTIANLADHKVTGAVVEVWEQEGWTEPAEGLEADYGSPAGEGETPGEHEGFLETRAAGRETLARGAPEQAQPFHELVGVLEAALVVLDERLQASDMRFWALRETIDAALPTLRANPWGSDTVARLDELIAAVGELREGVEDAGERALVDGLDAALHEVSARFGHEMGLAEPPERAPGEHEHGERSEVFYERQMETLDAWRGPSAVWRPEGVRPEVERPLPGASAPTEESADVAHDAGERLFLEIERIFGHPYDSNWWWDAMVGWCNSNRDVLAAYILERNAGRAHHHG